MESRSEKVPIMHLGQLRTGITVEQAALDNRILRFLARAEPQRSGVIAAQCQTAGTKAVKAALDRLALWQLVELRTTTFPGSFLVSLTEQGRREAEKLRAQVRAEIAAMATIQE